MGDLPFSSFPLKITQCSAAVGRSVGKGTEPHIRRGNHKVNHPRPNVMLQQHVISKVKSIWNLDLTTCESDLGCTILSLANFRSLSNPRITPDPESCNVPQTGPAFFRSRFSLNERGHSQYIANPCKPLRTPHTRHQSNLRFDDPRTPIPSCYSHLDNKSVQRRLGVYFTEKAGPRISFTHIE